MADLTADANVQYYGNPTKIEVPAVGADTYYKGALVFADATTGYANVGSNIAAGDRFLGICAKQTVTTAQGDLVPIYIDGVWGFEISGTAVADIGEHCIVDATVISDNPDDLVASADVTEGDNDILVGEILSVHNSRAWVNIGVKHPLYTTTATGVAGFKDGAR